MHAMHIATTLPIKPKFNNGAQTVAFQGFHPLRSNTTFTPNQFFDVALRHGSRGCVRLVGYMIRRSLGWCDAEGNPAEEQIQLSYRQLMTEAGISRGALRPAIDEAIQHNFIREIVAPSPARQGETAVNAVYELAWHTTTEYEKQLDAFRGFFEGQGNRTDIPNQFFDHVVRHEPLAVVKVVGTVIRWSIGFQAKRGTRRQHVALSYTRIQRHTGLSRDAVNTAVKVALQKKYIVRTKSGVFDSAAGKLSCAATYSLCWSDLHPAGVSELDGASPAGKDAHKGDAPLNRFKKPTGNPSHERIDNLTGSGSKTKPEKRFNIPTGIETKLRNETLKQQREVAGVAKAAETSAADATDAVKGEQLLVEAGFLVERARDLAGRHPLETIKRQINWLPHRKGVRNKLGLLKAAIENDWEAPVGMQGREQDSDEREFVRHFYAGFAGNSETPVAEPSAFDIEAVRPLVAELNRAVKGNPDPAGWGRRLGKLARDEGQRIPAIAVAVRHRGDRFLVRMKSRTVKQEAKESVESREAARESHRNRYEGAYYDFLRSKEAIMAKAKPKELEAFDMERAKKRERDRKSARPWMNEQWFRHFDRDETRLSELAKHFGLPDFWQWDQNQDRDRESNAQKTEDSEYPQGSSLAENSTT